jgi:hypothetical protein
MMTLYYCTRFRGYPLWTQYIVGREFIDARIDELQTAHVVFVDGVYEEIDASVWCRRVLESFDKFLATDMGGDEGVRRLEKPQGWDKFPFSQCELRASYRGYARTLLIHDYI